MFTKKKLKKEKKNRSLKNVDIENRKNAHQAVHLKKIHSNFV
jgi:hypothetical protein